MATLIDNAGTQHYANKMVLAENRKVGVKSLPSALADVDNLIEEMKGHFEAEYGSALDMKLENSSGVFSVGTGSGVDKRDEVENSFTDVEIKGRTLQNLMINCINENCFNVYNHWNVIAENTFEVTANESLKYLFLKKENILLKNSTKYTIILDVLENTIVSEEGKPSVFTIFGSSGAFGGGEALFVKDLPNRRIFLKTTRDDINIASHSLDSYLDNKAISGKLKIRLLILEGDYTNTPIEELPYVEGIQGVGEEVENGYEVGVKSCGKNLCPPLKLLKGLGSAPSFLPSPTDQHKVYRTIPHIPLSKGTYSLYCNNKNVYIRQIYDAKKGVIINSVVNNYKVTFTVEEDIILTLYMRDKASSGTEWSFGENTSDIGMTIVNERVFDENEVLQYIEDTLTYTLDEQLHRLPNGVCDEISNGNLIRRIGKLVLDGSEKWNRCNADDVSWAYECVAYRDLVKTNNKNSFIFVTPLLVYSKDCYAGGKPDGWFLDGNKDFWIRLRNDKLSVVSDVGFKQWLQENPITVYYELATPIITELDTPSLQCWKNGTISIDSTVPPTSTHTVALNKPAQIKRNIEELTALREKVKTLEEQYDQIALEQAHKLELLNHSFELDYNI